MSWHAVDAVDDAVETTRRFLFPFSLVRWTKLAFLVLLMGGGAGASSSVSTSIPSAPGGGLRSQWVTDPDSGAVSVGPFDGALSLDGTLLAAVGIGIVLFVAALSVCSLSLRLVFYDALRTDEVRLWRPFLSRLRQAAGLFVLSVFLGVTAALPVVLAVLVAVPGSDPVGWRPADAFAESIARLFAGLSTGPTVAIGLLGVAVVLIAAFALRFTYEFVVPIMVAKDTGVIAGWRRFLDTLRRGWSDVLVYLVVHFFVGVGISIVEGIAFVLVGATVVVLAGFVLLLAAIPLGGLGALGGTTVGTAVLAIVVVASILLLAVFLLPVSVVTRTYRIAYEVSTLGGIDTGVALLHRDIDPNAPTPDTPDPERAAAE
ncbi:DUF7544 domain-containing protein [Halorubrum trueperi]|uniref:Membrane domain of glycerophosphoryl diester phosphodiesterase n=1 Tax=Halorubrum trueperi TaxID=2004704 RepID=A0ABD5UNA7_9EURY